MKKQPDRAVLATASSTRGCLNGFEASCARRPLQRLGCVVVASQGSRSVRGRVVTTTRRVPTEGGGVVARALAASTACRVLLKWAVSNKPPDDRSCRGTRGRDGVAKEHVHVPAEAHASFALQMDVIVSAAIVFPQRFAASDYRRLDKALL
ncbi:hypothetical protein MTO96_011880 [Rhipicephalus appendiculatus]